MHRHSSAEKSCRCFEATDVSSDMTVQLSQSFACCWPLRFGVDLGRNLLLYICGYYSP